MKLTQKHNLAIAEICGTADRWFIEKGGWLYRPNASGYTEIESEAGIYTEKEAIELISHCNELTIRRATPINYIGSLDAMHSAEEKLEGPLAGEYDSNLWMVLNRDWYNNGGKGIISSWHATDEQKAEAFLWTFGKIESTLDGIQ